MGQLSGWALRARGRISGVISGSDLLLRSGTITAALPVGWARVREGPGQ